MEFSLKFDTVKSGWSIVDIEGSLVIISKKYSISISVPNSTKALCSISSVYQSTCLGVSDHKRVKTVLSGYC